MPPHEKPPIVVLKVYLALSLKVKYTPKKFFDIRGSRREALTQYQSAGSGRVGEGGESI
jgi:hypothetical protein